MPSPVDAALPDASGRIPFGANPLDRCDALRLDTGAIDALAAAPGAKAVLVAGEAVLVDPALGGAGVRHPLAGVAGAGERIFLGRDAAGDAHFAIDLTDAPPVGLVALPLRAVAGDPAADPGVVGIVAQARSLVAWHATHRFCARCGAPTIAAAGGTRRVCSACAAEHFPRTDPVVIMLVRSGGDCLLARAPRFQTGFYSTLAGFMEPGETIESAVRREVMEETGIRVGRVTYVASQPWPFPSSLMIGCIADAESRDITVDTHELVDARWFGRDEVESMLSGSHPDGLTAPKPLAIAHHLMKFHLSETESVEKA